MIKKLLVSIILLITIFQVFSPFAFALELEGNKHITFTGRTVTGHLLYTKKDGSTSSVKCSIVGYNDNGKFYPAYCLNVNNDGAEEGEYDVDISKYIDNEEVWRIVTHGYPYTTNFNGIELDPDDAYMVTKIAIYCVTFNSYFGMYTKDDRNQITVNTYNALDYLVNTVAKDTNIHKQEGTISVNKVGEFVENGNYYSQDYEVVSILDEKSYEVKDVTGFPEGTIISNLSNSPQNVFEAGEKFRILIPKSGLNKEINGNFNIVGKVKNYPVFFGDSKDSSKQNYVVTFDEFGDELATVNFKASVNTGKVKVLKVDSETKEPISGVTFKLRKDGQEEALEGTTNEKGEIIFENLFPGKYTLKETKTREEYKINTKEFEVEVRYNEQSEVTVENDIIKGFFRIIKQDLENSKIRLAGVQFELYDEDMNLLETLETDEKGEAISKEYPSVNRKYYLKEIKTVEGYSFSSKLYEIYLLDNTMVDIFVKNSRIPKDPEVIVIEEELEPEVVTVYEKPDPIIETVYEEPEIIEEVIKLPRTRNVIFF